MDPISNGRRRMLGWGGLALAGLGGVAGLRWGLPQVRVALSPDLAFAPLSQPPGFRRLAGQGRASGGVDPFLGMGGGAQDVAAPPDDLCAALFGGPAPEGIVPAAYFTDYNCPFCRVLGGHLRRLEAGAGGALRLQWHELPLLGPDSVLAAQAALAAKRQGAYDAFHRRLDRARFQMTPAYIATLAEGVGLDPDRLAADMTGPAVARDLGDSAALARIFGISGTPGLVLGRTVVLGVISEPALARLLAREVADGPVPACGG
ncbi:MAG: DsbA family protein [Qingshengfaniella sp.]